jgi:hypothetical protein
MLAANDYPAFETFPESKDHIVDDSHSDMQWWLPVVLLVSTDKASKYDGSIESVLNYLHRRWPGLQWSKPMLTACNRFLQSCRTAPNDPAIAVGTTAIAVGTTAIATTAPRHSTAFVAWK